MDNSLTSYTHKGKKQWSLCLPDTITCVELLHYKPRSFKAVLVALQNREVRIYKDKFLVNCIQMDVRGREGYMSTVYTALGVIQDVVVGIKFGSFGREDGVLLMVMRGGALSIKILKRSVNFEVKDMTPGPPAAQLEKLNIPKRTKVYVDQMAREKENGVGKEKMYILGVSDLSTLSLHQPCTVPFNKISLD